jgi:hypothetical protein
LKLNQRLALKINRICAVNPLSVAINKSEKNRLILDLSVLNKFVKKEKFKFKEWKTVVQFFNKDMLFFFQI